MSNSKVGIDNYEYRLYFGSNIKDPAKKVTEIPPLHAKQNAFIKIGTINYYIVLSGLKFTRKVYEPGLIEAEATIKPSSGAVCSLSFEEVNELFSMREVELSVVDLGKSKNEDYEKTIAIHYYVYMINSQIKTDCMYVKLTIHSFDKLMTIDKYCKAFTAKKLASDILAKECTGFGLNSDMVNASITNLQHLKYKNGKNDVEMIQPYLVQYNESFYDFMVRTANRCGEYLYFEDGRLTLGLPESKTETIESFEDVTMQGYTSGPIDVQDYSRDSVKDNGNLDGTLNYDVIKKDEAGYPTDTFMEKPQYNTPLGGDEYIFPLENDKYYNLKREVCIREGEWPKTALLRLAGAVAKEEDGDVYYMATKAVGKMASDTTTAEWMKWQNDKDVVDKVNKKWKGKAEQYANNRLVVFSSLDSNGWIGRDFYSRIRHEEEQLHRRIICIDMGTTYIPVRLGESISVKGLKGDYIVVQVSLIANLAWQHNFRKFDPASPATDLYSDRQSQIIYAIPVGHPKNDKGEEITTENIIMPPVAPVPMIRKAGPQTAYVVDNSDKKYQGRVRIAYPWQSPLDNKRQEMFAAAESLRKANEEKEALTREKKELEDILKLLQNAVSDQLDALEGMSKDDLQKIYEKWKQEVEADKTEMDTLDAELPDPILINNPDPDASTDITYDQYTANEKVRNNNRQRYDQLEKNVAQKQLLLDYLDNARDDKQAIDLAKAKNAVDDDSKRLKTGEADKDKEINKQKDKIKNLENTLEEKKKGWESTLSGMATPWVRVATPMATDGGGLFFKPCVGDEVLVNFDSDNVERPYVVGSVYSKNVLNPTEQHERQVKDFLVRKSSMTIMSPNGQHISFCAPSDGWKFIQGISPTLKTLQTYVPSTWVKLKGDVLKGDEKDLNGGIFMGDRYGMYELSLSSHDRKIKILSPFGNVEIGAFSGITISAPNGDIKIRGKNISIEAGNKLTLHSGQNVKEKKEATLKGLVGTAVKEELSPIKDVLKVVDFNILRCFFEVFLRPIDGTLCLKSNNYLMLEAGKGKAQVPLERYTSYYQNKLLKEPEAEKNAVYSKIAAYIQRIDGKVTRFQNDYMELKRAAFREKAVYDQMIKAIWRDNDTTQVVKKSFVIGDKEFVPTSNDLNTGTLKDEIKSFNVNNLKERPANGYKIPNHPPTLDVHLLQKNSIRNIADNYGRAIAALQKKSRQIKTMFDDYTIKAVNQSLFGTDSDQNTKWIDDKFKSCTYGGNDTLPVQQLNKWEQRYGAKENDPKEPFMKKGDLEEKADPFFDLKIMKRKMIAIFLANLNLHPSNSNGGNVAPGQKLGKEIVKGKYITITFSPNDVNDKLVTDKWAEVLAMGDNLKGTADELLGFLNDTFQAEKILKDVKDIVSLRTAQKVWNSESGQIIFSSRPGATYAFKGDEIQKFDVSNQNKNKDALKKTIGKV